MDVRELLAEMVKQDASDLYLTVGSPPMYRVEGITRPFGTEELAQEACEALAVSIMTEKQRTRFIETLEMDLALHFPELGRFRVNLFRQRGYVGVVIRQIKLTIKSLDELKLPEILKKIAMEKRGFVLVVGGTGTGKSTTLAAMVDYRNSNSPGHIISVEDPIEFVHEHKQSIITQREVGLDTHTFADALKHTLRQAPDVILIGEIRDIETMESGITFAETGHLCLGTLHANNANQAIERIMNFFPSERHLQIYLQLSMNLKAIVSQRLIPSVDGARAAAIEILLDSPRVKDLIHKGRIDILKEAMQMGAEEGMQTFDRAIYDLYKQGRISYDNALAYADSVNDIRLRIKVDEVGEKEEEKAEGPEDQFTLKGDLLR